MAQAAATIADQSPNTVFCYAPLGEDSGALHIVAKTTFTLENIIMHCRLRGLYIRLSLGNNTEHDTRLAGIYVVDEALSFIPGAIFINPATNVTSMECLLRSLSYAIEGLAKNICADIDSSEHDLPDDRKILLREAQFIVARDFSPDFVNVYRDLPTLKVIQAVWPTARIRIPNSCVLESVRRFGADVGLGQPHFDDNHSRELAWAIRRFQRISDESDIIYYKRHFFQDIFKMCTQPLYGSGNDTLAERVHEANEGAVQTHVERFRLLITHFEKEWMTSFWIPYWTDLGFPATHARASSNSDNAAQSAFRIFDHVFINSKKNRGDRVPLMTMYAQDCDNVPDDPAVQSKLHEAMIASNVGTDDSDMKVTIAAQILWERGRVTEQQAGKHIVRTQFKDGDGKKTVKEDHVQVDRSECTCTRFKETGKLCVHLQAARLYQFSGPP